MSTDLVPLQSDEMQVASPLPVFRAGQMVEALKAYRDLQRALDESMPDQIMQLDGKPYRKKGYWRAIAVAFNLTVEPVDERRETSGSFQDGNENFGYIVTYRASTPAGRAMTGDGACFAIEKSKGRSLEKLPHGATEHNVRSHAHTRAFNRAVSNLVAFGEVSAEEVEQSSHGETEQSEPRTQPAPSTYPTPHKRESVDQVISEAQGKRFWAIAKGKGYTDDQIKTWLRDTYQLNSTRDIPRGRYEEICDAVQR